jgi:hypothetical protein
MDKAEGSVTELGPPSVTGWRGPAVGPETNGAWRRRRWNGEVIFKDAGSWGSVAFFGHGIVERNGRSLMSF